MKEHDWKPGWIIVYKGTGRARDDSTYPVKRRQQIFTKSDVSSKGIDNVRIADIYHVNGITRVIILYEQPIRTRAGTTTIRTYGRDIELGYHATDIRLKWIEDYPKYYETGPTC